MKGFAWLIVAVLVLVGCAAAPAPGGAPSGELRWSIEGVSDVPSIDPAFPGNAQSINVISLIFGGLVQLDGNLTVQPDGAESWRVSPDGKVYTFSLRSNLRFADGTPVVANDFVYSINRALDPTTKSFAAPSQLSHIVGAKEKIDGKADTISGVRAIDDRTLEITLDTPIAYFLSQLTYPYTFVLPKKLVDQGANWTDMAYGTGPFKVKTWTHNQEIVLEANPNYWRGAPGVATVRFRFFQDSEPAYQEYRAGKLDVMGNQQNGVPANRVGEVQNMPDFRTAASLTVRYVGFNNRLPPFNNRYVRQAFALAVDKGDLASNVLSGTVLPTDRILPTGMAGSQLSVKGQMFNPTGARAALGLAGFVSGQGLPPITLTYGLEGDNQKVVEALQRYWRDNLGVEVKAEGLSISDFSQRLDDTYHQPEQGLQLYLSVWGADYPDPQNFLSQQLRTDSANNNGHWSDAMFDQLVDKADTMGGQQERDERLRLYVQAEQIALDEVGWLPLYNPELNVLVRPNVRGLIFTPQGIIAPNWTEVYVQ